MVNSGTELGALLRQLRKTAGLNQVDVCARAKVSQARLSRIEQGQSLPTEGDVRELAALYRADDAQREQLRLLARDAHAGVEDRRFVVQAGVTLGLQQRWRRMEERAGLVRGYHPGMVLGALQIPAYTAVAMGEPTGSDAVTERQLRRRRLLTKPTPRYELIQTEGALRWRVGSAEVVAEQVEAIIEASLRPNVSVGVIPWWREVDVTPACGFDVFDSQVVVGLEIAAAMIPLVDTPEFDALFEHLRGLAVWGDEARAELRRIVDETAESVT